MSTEAETSTPPSAASGLQADVLGASDAVVMAVAGSAPAYSIAASTAALIAAVGVASAASLLWCAIPMLGIAWAFSYLGRADVNAGAAYAWVGRALHPLLGFVSGWALIVSATIFMVAGSLPAGSLTLTLFSPDLANNTALVTVVGAAWFLVMVGLVVAGVRTTATAQWIMSGIEVAILIVFAALALAKGGTPAGIPFSWSWLGFSHFHGTGGFVAGALIASFFYWGWDVTANLNEETTHSKRLSALGGLIGIVIVFALFEAFTIAINITLSGPTIASHAGNVLAVLGDTVLPGVGGKILIIGVMLSTIATLETTLIQVSRSLFAMGRDHTLPRAFGKVHATRRTPWFATLVVTVVSLVLFVLSNLLGSISQVLTDAISAIGLQIAIYYALAGLAVVVAYRHSLFASVGNFVFIGLWPLLGAGFMAWIFVEAIPSLGATVDAIGLGAVALGLIPLVAYFRKSPYYRTPPLEPLGLSPISPEQAVPGQVAAEQKATGD